MTTVIYEDRVSEVAAALDMPGLWLPPDDLQAASGWELKPEGACRDGVCVLIPNGRVDEFVGPDGRLFNLAALAELLGAPVAHDADSAIWAFGEAPATRQEAMRSLVAPDFSLPDLDGTLHSLSEQRGKKVLLVSWASW